MKFLRLVEILKVTRVLRIEKFISYLNVSEEVKTTLNLIKLTIFQLLYIHIVGCIWWYIVSADNSWIPPLDYQNNKTDLYV